MASRTLRKKSIFLLVGLLVSLVSTLTLVYLDEKSLGTAKKGLAKDRKSQEPPPLYGGITSPGGPPIPVDANNKPLYFFEGKVEWEKLGIKEPRTGWEYAQRGIYYQDELGDILAAVADYQKAIAMEPELMIPRARMGSLYLRQGQYDEAIAQLQPITTLDPMKQEVYYRIGLAYEGKGDYASAIEAYRHELELAPGSTKTHYALAQAYQQIGDDKQASFHLKRYLDETKLHGDNYPLRIRKAEQMYAELQRRGVTAE